MLLSQSFRLVGVITEFTLCPRPIFPSSLLFEASFVKYSLNLDVELELDDGLTLDFKGWLALTTVFRLSLILANLTSVGTLPLWNCLTTELTLTDFIL